MVRLTREEPIMKQNRRLNIVIDYEITCDVADVPYVEANINEAVKTFVKEALVEDLNKSVDTKSVWLNGVPFMGQCCEPKQKPSDKRFSDFDIWNNAPRKVQCIRNDNNSGWWGDSKHELKVGELYDVVNVEVHDSYTLVTLNGINHPFNSVLFAEV